ncbi:hypothetical protein Tc00.1047053511367.40 [Trypanosoma cruzi]|uniref:Uncharacterized protein n=1 Tax=Trypanosoma cruzi (strain CL Brener) TaxID=353153 RepID=Q4DYI8_TRYCC|nr:hypothetical protein Tc00.1047053511367.40 [Trypanosoma cruzi]EAN97563.1 hypothetical protein Tc00.1047053511367.40 [Trypanosoma cruzi]|eukprot:XP_819414.1 hypothetical protein [Trypanosoma cruzi strain CL Brener]
MSRETHNTWGHGGRLLQTVKLITETFGPGTTVIHLMDADRHLPRGADTTLHPGVGTDLVVLVYTRVAFIIGAGLGAPLADDAPFHIKETALRVLQPDIHTI